MTKQRIKFWTGAAIVYFVGLLALGVILSCNDHSEKRIVYETFKDLIPIQIAIPAAWLTYCFQRRLAYLQHLRAFWTRLIEAIQVASQYTVTPNPTRTEHFIALSRISTTIEEIRGLFTNLRETSNSDGLYPFEPLKDIYSLIEDLKCDDDFNKVQAALTRNKVHALWKAMRTELLKEFDRETPTFSHSHWDDFEKRRVYEANSIPPKLT